MASGGNESSSSHVLGTTMSDLPERRQSYRHPPIEEAIVEFRFVSGQEWDPTISGKLHQRLADVYSGKPRPQKVLEAELQAVPGKATNFAWREATRVQLVDSIEKRIVSVGEDVLSVSTLRPYDGWEHFRPRIEAVLDAYLSVTNAEGIRRLGHRYINKIVLPTDAVLPEYFRCGPPNIPELPDHVTSFLNRTEYKLGESTALLVSFTNVPSEPATFLLDLDVAWQSPEPLSVTDAMAMLDQLHEHGTSAFEALITDRTREVIDAD